MRFCAIVLLALVASGCSSTTSVCTEELGARFTPSTQTIDVGASFTAAVELSSCGGRVQPADAISWASSNSSVAIVNASTGRVEARTSGVADIVARGERFGTLGSVAVTVR